MFKTIIVKKCESYLMENKIKTNYTELNIT